MDQRLDILRLEQRALVLGVILGGHLQVWSRPLEGMMMKMERTETTPSMTWYLHPKGNPFSGERSPGVADPSAFYGRGYGDMGAGVSRDKSWHCTTVNCMFCLRGYREGEERGAFESTDTRTTFLSLPPFIERHFQ